MKAHSHWRSLFALFLAFSMLFSLLPKTVLAAAADGTPPETVYVEADSIVSGGKYIIAYVDGDTAHCLDADELQTSSSSTAVNATELDYDPDDGTILTDDESLIWTLEASGTAWYIRPLNDAAYSLYLGGGSAFYLNNSSEQRALTYSSGILSYKGNSTYYINYSASGGTFGNSSSGTALVFFEESENTDWASLKDASVAVGNSVELTLTRSTSLEGLPVTWESEHEDIATVDDEGIVTGISAGTVTVTATVGGITASCTVTVAEHGNYIQVSDFAGSGEYILAYVEGNTAHCLDYDKLSTSTSSTSAGATDATVSESVISTLDESLVWSVSESEDDWYVRPAGGGNSDKYLYLTSGKIYLGSSRAYEYDSATGYLTYSSSSGSTYHLTYEEGSFINDTAAQTGSVITLFKKLVSPTDISVEDAEVGVGETIALTPTVTPENATCELTWEVTVGGSIASVDGNGVVTGLGAGTATVTVSIDGTALSDSCQVTVLGPTSYVRVSDFEEGGEYILAYVEGDTAYCLDYDLVETDSSATSAPATNAAISDNVISTGDMSLRWSVTAGDGGWIVKPAGGENSGKNLYLSNGKIYLNSTSRTYAYDSGTGYLTYYSENTESTYHLTYSSGAFINATEAQTGSVISLFTKTALPTGITMNDATVEVGKTVTLTPTVAPAGATYTLTFAVTAGGSCAAVNANGVVTGLAEGAATVTVSIDGTALSDSCTLTVSAQTAGEEAFVGVTSDVHASLTNLENWLTHVPADLDHMAYCGDYSYSTGGSAQYIADFAGVVDLTDTYVGDGLGVYTSGNHEYSTSGTLPSSLTDLGLLRIGEAVREDNYIIYCMGAPSGSGEFLESDIATLRSYLIGAPTDIPIFILSHYPLHYISSRTITNADDMIALLNEHPNTVFFWGHNHSQGSAETHYGQILTAGDTVTYSSGHSSEINFTYACAGAMYSTQQSPYYGLVATVAGDGDSVSFSYYDLDGDVANLKNTGLPSLTVYMSSAVNANLSSLSYSIDGGISYIPVPGFSPSATSYDVTLPYGTPDGPVLLQGVCASGDASVTANPGTALMGGAATAMLTVTGGDDITTKTYSVDFTVSTSLGTEYKLADSFVDGGKYIIAYVSGSTASCLDADTVPKSSSTASSAATVQTVSGNTITTADTTIVWSATKSGDAWLLSPAYGGYTSSLYMGNGPSLYLAASGRAMNYSGNILSYTSSYSTYYLAYSGGSFAASTSAGSEVLIFAESVAATGITIPQTASIKVGRSTKLAATLTPSNATSPVSWSVASGSEPYVSVDQNGLVTGLLPGLGTVVASANGHYDTCLVTVSAWPTGTRYLGFTSDTHYETGAANNLDTWLTGVSGLYPSIDYMGLCGDMASTSSSSITQYWQFVQAMVDTVNGHSAFVTDGGIYTTGNHEMYSGSTAGGDYASVKNTNATAALVTQTGVAAANEDYIIYTFGACNNVTSSTVQEFTQAQITALEADLDGAPCDVPIFIMSHYPLHYDGNRVAERSEDVIAILNEHPNVIFLWGHNHSDADDEEDGYDNIQKAGAVLTTLNADGGASKQTVIQFTYASAGCMSDEEYDAGSAAVLGKGVIAEINDITGGKRVTLTYYNLEGNTLTIPGKITSTSVDILGGTESYTIGWDTDGDGDVDETTTVAYGTLPSHADGSKEADAQYTYTFASWSPALTEVTGPATYTATFTSELRSYDIGWDTDGDGDVDETTTVAYGTTTTHANGSKPADAQYTYTFFNWDPMLDEVTGPATYTATFTSELRSYEIGWDTDGDGDVDDTTTVAYGTLPSHADGSKPADAQYTYTFASWSPALTDVTGPTTYTATFSTTAKDYSVSYTLNGGTNPDGTPTVYTFGIGMTLPIPSKANYNFGGWYDNEGLTGTAVTAISETETGDKAFFAKWTLKTIGGGSSGGGGGGGSVIIPEPLVPMAAAGELPYYFSEDGKQKIFIGFAYDLNADNIITQGEYVAPAGKTIQFAANEKTFSDVASDWAAPYIAFVTDREIFTGTSETTFTPDGGMTRAMFVTVIGRLYERSYGMISGSELHKFTAAGDCDYTAYYGKYVDWAVSNSIITGYDDGTFRPNGMITRQEMAVIIGRFAAHLQIDVACMASPTFSDNTAIAAWAENSVAYCFKEGIITGRTDGSFDPASTATRKDVAAIIARFVQAFLS